MSETEKRNMSLATDITTTTNDEDDGLFVDVDSDNSSEDSDADMAECSNGFDEAIIDQGTVTYFNFCLVISTYCIFA